jgi:hypothetical protein
MAAQSPYEVLGSPDASADDIRKPFPQAGQAVSPDLNPETRSRSAVRSGFAAYDLVSIRKAGALRPRGDRRNRRRAPPPHYRAYAEGPGGRKYQPEGEMDLGDLEDLLQLSAPRRRGGTRVANSEHAVAIASSLQSPSPAHPAQETLSLPRRVVDVTIPPGIEDGQVLRLRRGRLGRPGAAGDALIEVHVALTRSFAATVTISDRAAGQPRRGGSGRE